MNTHGAADQELRQNLALICSQRVDVTAEELLIRAETFAWELVCTYWVQIHLLAQALLKTNTLHGDEVMEAMCEPISLVGAEKFNAQLSCLEDCLGSASGELASELDLT